MNSASSLIALSATHHTAGLDARAAFTVSTEQKEKFYETLRGLGIKEAVILATCNRLEVYVVGNEAAALLTRNAMVESLAIMPETLDQHLRPISGLKAVEHLFSVVSGIDSQMVGEVEIAGQVKEVYADALARGMTGPILNRVFQKAFQAAAWARTNTGISSGQTSTGNVAVDLTRRVFGSLKETQILVLGTGEVGKQVVQALVSRGASRVSVASRTYENARRLAEEFSGAALNLIDAINQAHLHDVIVGCASVERALINKESIKEITRQRQGRPLLLIDLGVPRNFDTEARTVEGVYLCDLDDLAAVANANLKTRMVEVNKAKLALQEKASRTWTALHPAPFTEKT